MAKVRISLLISCFLLMVTVFFKSFEPDFVVAFQNRTFDLYQKLKPRTYEPVPVRIVDIDDESLKRYGQWPWPRTVLASLTQKLRDAGAAVVVFDIVFAEPDRTSPMQVARMWDAKPGLKQEISQLPDHDAVFADVIDKSPVVTGFVLTNGDGKDIPADKAGFAYVGSDPSPYAPPYSSAVTTLPILEVGALGNGAFNDQPDSDGFVRCVPMLMRLGDTLYPSLVAETLRVAQGASSYVVKTVGASGEYGGTQGITAVKIGNVVVPTDANGRQWVYYTGYVPSRYIPAWQVLEDAADPELLNGNIVFVGTSAAGLKDIRVTPLNPVTPGVEVHAQAVEQALLGITMVRPEWVKGAEIMIMVFAGLLLIMVCDLLTPLWGALFMFLMLGAAAGVSWYAFAQYNVLVEPVMPALAVSLVHFSYSLSRYIRSEQEKVYVRDAFSHYMAPELVEQLAKDPDKLALGGESRVLSVMFCDMHNFTAISEQLPPVALTQLMNSFLTPVTDVVLAEKGTVDKFIGDSVMAFWNAPLSDRKHALHAARAALKIRHAIEMLNQERVAYAAKAQRKALKLSAAIGINSGECCVGNMGTTQRFNYTAMGDGVNVAFRLQNQCSNYGVDIILGENTVKELHGLAILELDILRVKGRVHALRIYALLGDEAMAAMPEFSVLASEHNTMLVAYRHCEWDVAETALNNCMKTAFGICPELCERLYPMFLDRIKRYRQYPPEAGWDGVYHDRRG